MFCDRVLDGMMPDAEGDYPVGRFSLHCEKPLPVMSRLYFGVAAEHAGKGRYPPEIFRIVPRTG